MVGKWKWAMLAKTRVATGAVEACGSRQPQSSGYIGCLYPSCGLEAEQSRFYANPRLENVRATATNCEPSS